MTPLDDEGHDLREGEPASGGPGRQACSATVFGGRSSTQATGCVESPDVRLCIARQCAVDLPTLLRSRFGRRGALVAQARSVRGRSASKAAKCAEFIAARWANARKVAQPVFKRDRTRRAKDAPLKRNDQLVQTLSIGGGILLAALN
jgi:hypothetical protein